MGKKERERWEFGDFQTPLELARKVVDVLVTNHGTDPDWIIEPTCGEGAFLCAAAERFPESAIRGFDVNPNYVAAAKDAIATLNHGNVVIEQADFFLADWHSYLKNMSGKLLVLGNPPWVTSSELGLLNSKNLPPKTNFQGRRGIEAITGSGNFDISEWMLLQHVEWLYARSGAIAFLCKYAVARKIMKKVRESGRSDLFGHIYSIDATKHFSAAVDACLFVLATEGGNADCEVFHDLSANEPYCVIGERDGIVVRDILGYEKHSNLRGQDPYYVWRSGIKHDCAKVMEIAQGKEGYINGLGETVAIESGFVFPLLKSSDVGNQRVETARKGVIVPQISVGGDTSILRVQAPETWKYLVRHRELLAARRSSIYRGKPEFSIFGVGPYTFAPWKVAISSMYKGLTFSVVGPIGGKPVVFDDTVVFLPCYSREEAQFVYELLTSEAAMEFLSSNIFWEDKRPITTGILRRLSLKAVAEALGRKNRYLEFIESADTGEEGQMPLGIAEVERPYPVPRDT